MRRLVFVVVLLAVIGGGVWFGLDYREQQRVRAIEQARVDAGQTAAAFADAWTTGQFDAMPRFVTGFSGELAETYRSTGERLQLESVAAVTGAPTLADPEDPSAGATVPMDVTLTLGGLGELAYAVQIPLLRREETSDWRIDWSPALLHPDLQEGDRLERSLTWPQRAPILGPDGTILDTSGTTLGILVGRVGEITAERLEQLGAPYAVGNQVGSSGLQAAYEGQLAGAPTAAVAVVAADASVRSVLLNVPGREAEPVQVTLDVNIQRAAEAALPEGPIPAAMVVLDSASGGILAVVNRPAAGFNRALSGRYPPGSTFKVVTGAAVLRSGITPATVVDCNAEARIIGRRFGNFQGQAFGPIPFGEAFYRSCNTAFVEVAAGLPDNALADAATSFGFNSGWSLPGSAPIASYPEPSDLAERAAAAIGQARVEGSPVQMASVGAAVASGTWKAPQYVIDDTDRPTGDVSDVAPTLTALMQEVPRIGTAKGAGLPDGVAGKTGTAEFGSAGELNTRAWFIGFDPRTPDTGTLAFSVLVEEGSSGGAVAAPIAAKFLANLGRG